MITAAGVVLIKVDAHEPLTLLLHDPNTGHWGPPKGLLEVGEGLIEGALREVAEETGIILSLNQLLVAREQKISYRVSPLAEEKVVYFYPSVNLPSDTSCVLSAEHDAFCWASVAELKRFITQDNLLALLCNALNAALVIERIANIRYRCRAPILDIISRVAMRDCPKGVEWFIGGSFAANEETWSEQGILKSDIDLVAYSEILSEVKVLRQLINCMAEEISLALGLLERIHVSVFLVTPRTELNYQDPFWSYCLSHVVPVNGADPGKIHRQVVCRPFNFSYACYRMLWYRYLDLIVGVNDLHAEYKYTKHVVLAAMLLSVKSGSVFESYDQLRVKLINKCIDSPNCFEGNDMIAYRWMIFCLENKIFGVQMGGDIHVKPQEEALVILNCIEAGLESESNDDAFLISQYLLRTLSGLRDLDNGLYRRVQDFLSNMSDIDVDIKIMHKNQAYRVAALAIFRLLRWPNEVKYSLWRYVELAQILKGGRHNKSHNDLVLKLERTIFGMDV